MKEKITLSRYNPDLATQWHPTKNGDLTPDLVTYGSNKKVWWLCPTCNHEWEAMVYQRSRGNGCPACAGKAALRGVTDLATTCPDIAAQWHPTENGDLKPDQVAKFSHKKVWWICPTCDHKWLSTVYNRYRGAGCPHCANHKRRGRRRKSPTE